MSKSLIAFDTDHIKGYVFGTNKLKEIRGASSILDRLNRVRTKKIAESATFKASTIYAHGGSALFLIDSDKAEQLGKAVQKLYDEKTGGGASITYAIQPIPNYSSQNIMTATQLSENFTMLQALKLLRLRLRLAKDSLQTSGFQKDNFQEDTIAIPSHALLYTCDSCGIGYAEEMLKDPDDPEGLYCCVCIKKRMQDRVERKILSRAQNYPASNQTLWQRIIQTLKKQDSTEILRYELPNTLERPKDFNVFREFTRGKEYLGLIYADANGMGQEIEKQETLQKLKNFAQAVDDAVFGAMGDAIKTHLPIQQNKFPFDILLVGGDDIVMVTPAEKALQVAYTLAKQFQVHTEKKGIRGTLSVGVVLAPVKYPFSLQHNLVEETIRAAKKSGAENKKDGDSPQEPYINFVIVTGNTSSSYDNIYKQMYQKKKIAENSEKFYATMRPYSLNDLRWLMEQIKLGNEKRLGRTKLHQLREAILKLNCTTAILESLILLHNWKELEREFIKQMVKKYDTRTPQQQKKETLFPWYLDGQEGSKNERIYLTPLLDFIELYDFVSSEEGIQ